MALILEDGTAPAGANAYASESMADAYFDDRAITDWTDSTGEKEAALIRATASIDATYRGRFPGYKANGRAQSLEWPRGLAYDVEGLLINGDEIPDEIINATCEAALRELVTPNSMLPDLDRGGGIEMLKAGSVEIKYRTDASAVTAFQIIDGILSGILEGGSGGGMFGYAVRG